MTTVPYDPATARKIYHPGLTGAFADAWSSEALLHDLGHIGLFAFFEGPGPDPTTLTGYGAEKIWLKTAAGVTPNQGTFHVWLGVNPATNPANWPVLTPAIYQQWSTGATADATTVSFREKGAAGDGVTNDRVAIQAAIDEGAATGKRVVGDPGDIYLVQWSGLTKQISTAPSPAYRYCLTLPSGVDVDFQGATVKLANNQDASVIMNLGSQVLTDTGTTIRNLVLDCNGANQAEPATGESCGILFYGVQGVVAKNISVINAYEYAGRFLACSGEFRGLHSVNSRGDGWSFGIEDDSPSEPYACHDMEMDDITAFAALGGTGLYSTRQGNGIIGCIRRGQIGSLESVSCAAGIKLQASTADLSVRSVLVHGLDNGTDNSGLKIQGDATNKPQRVVVGEVICRDQVGAGLYLYECRGVAVGSYIGSGNNSSGSYADVWIEGDDVSIGTVVSTDATAVGVFLRDIADNVQISSALITDVGGIGYAVNLEDCAGSGIDTLKCRGTIQRAVNSTVSTAVFHVDVLDAPTAVAIIAGVVTPALTFGTMVAGKRGIGAIAPDAALSVQGKAGMPVLSAKVTAGTTKFQVTEAGYVSAAERLGVGTAAPLTAGHWAVSDREILLDMADTSSGNPHNYAVKMRRAGFGGVQLWGLSLDHDNRDMQFVNESGLGADYQFTGAATVVLKLTTTGVAVLGGPARLKSYTVAGLASLTPAVGDTVMVSDSNAALAAGHGNVVAGGGANVVPVYHDGTNWRIG